MKNGLIGLLAVAAYTSQARAISLYSITDLGTPQGSESVAYDINNNGDRHRMDHAPDGTFQAVLWQPGQRVTNLGIASPYTSSLALKINNAGTILGWSGSSDPNSPSQPFIWKAETGLQNVGDTTLTLSSINDSGRAVGSVYLNSAGHANAVTYDPINGIQPISVPGNDVINAVKINNNNQILILTQNAAGMAGAIYQPNGSLAPVTGPTQNELHLSDMNDWGVVVGSMSSYRMAKSHAFSWDSVNGMRDLTPGDAIQSYAVAINNHSDVIGWEYRTDEMHEFPILCDGGQVYDMNSLLILQARDGVDYTSMESMIWGK